MLLIELNLVAGRGHPSHPVDECRGVSAGRPLPGQLADGGIELSLAEAPRQQAPQQLRVLAGMAELGKLVLEDAAIAGAWAGVPGVGERSWLSTLTADSALIVPVLNSMLDRWPSPTARRLITNRSSPGPQPAWSGCGTIDGLNSAAASSAYCWVKYAPIRRRRAALTLISAAEPVRD